jgi:pimeloyl-ACP methyl ester carboxylesterase
MKLHYADYGRDQSTTLVILHGLLGSERNWHSLAREFEKHVHVVAIDLRNHGASPHDPVHTIEAMRLDLEEFVEDHALDRFFLLGHSMGGHAAMDYSFHHPGRLRGLIVEDIAPRSYGTGLTTILSAMTELDLSAFHEKKQVDSALAGQVADPVVRHFLLTNLVRHGRELGWRAHLPALMDFAKNEIARFRADDLARYEGPTLFIGGQLSVYNLSREERLILKHFPNARVDMVERANHWVHFDAKEIFCRLVLDFVADH